jgi:hypothetical protein
VLVLNIDSHPISKPNRGGLDLVRRLMPRAPFLILSMLGLTLSLDKWARHQSGGNAVTVLIWACLAIAFSVFILLVRLNRELVSEENTRVEEHEIT